MFQSNEEPSSLVVTDFMLGNRVVKPNQKDSPISKHINETEEIILSPYQNSFGFRMSLLGFDSSTNNQLCYRLDGYDSEWNRLDGSSFHYSNVPAGNYVLHVKGMNDNGVWNESHAPISITVREKFFNTFLAKGLYVLLVICLIIFVSRYASDITRKRLQKKEDEERTKFVAKSYQEKIAFFSYVLHEIKTPLTLIRTPLLNIMSTKKFPKEVMDDLVMMRNSTDYMDHLTKELLDFVRLQQHGWQLNLKPINIIDKIDFVYSNVKDIIKSKNLEINFKHDIDELIISADESGLFKMLNNLMHNATKYAETFIELYVTQENDYMVLTVSNDGPIIPEERRVEIFKPFVHYSNDHSPYSKSFGIGLPLARTLAQLHGGSLVLSDDHSHTVFKLRLPITNESVQDVNSQTETEISLPDDDLGDRTKPLVLVVEDNQELAAYLMRKLFDDYRTVMANSAERALEIIEQENVDVIVSDIALNNMSGIEMCGIITSSPQYSHIPVILISALSSTEIKLACTESGARLYIEKPFDLDYLLGSLKTILQKKESLKSMLLSGQAITDFKEYALTNNDALFIAKFNEAIMNNLSDTEFGIDQLVNLLSVSKSTLLRKVKGLFDITPNDYIRIKRLNMAASLFSQGNVRVNEVCYAVGFNTHSYFTKCFKQQFGMSPGEYATKYGGKK
jgi:signal transduction histidine kinase/CheY-like chemotaxis protein/AraC-like DNA-binding protein